MSAVWNFSGSWSSLKQRTEAFWFQYPALGLGISALLGAMICLEHAFVGGCLWISISFWIHLRWAILHLAIILSTFLFCSFQWNDMPVPGEGQALFSMNSVQRHASPFQNGWRYTGTLRAFKSRHGQWTSPIPCRIIYMGDDRLRPKADCDYIVSGELRQHDAYDFSFRAITWSPVENSRSFAEKRFQAKERIHNILKQQLADWPTADFLAALFTGDIENRMLRFEFSRIGLQYLLVISGFHFAILASFVAFAVRFILPSRLRLWALLLALTAYFVFVGNSPPVFRSFLAAALFLTGQILQRRTSGLNILGACLLIEVLSDPLIVRNIGFQLSFLSCFGIFLLYHPLQQLVSRFLPIRIRSEVIRLSAPSQCVYVISSFFSRALVLTLAVNLALAPLLLYHFHRFPWLGLIYNLFAPAWTAASRVSPAPGADGISPFSPPVQPPALLDPEPAGRKPSRTDRPSSRLAGLRNFNAISLLGHSPMDCCNHSGEPVQRDDRIDSMTTINMDHLGSD